MKRLLLLLVLCAFTQLVPAQTLIPFTDGAKWGYCDQDRNIVIPLQYKECEPFYPNGLAVVRTSNEDYHLINKKGVKIIDLGIHTLHQMTDEVVVFEDMYEHYYFFNIREQKKSEAFGFLGGFAEGLAPYETNDEKEEHGYINLNGEKLFRNKFESVGSFNDGLAFVKQKGKYGFIDPTGKFVVKPQYDNVGDFSNGLAFVVKDDKLGYIDKSGKMVIPQIYDYIHDYVCTFRDSLVIAQKDGQKGCIDINGNTVLAFDYSYLFYQGNGCFLIRVNDKEKLIDKTGKEIAGDDIASFGSGFSEGWIRAEKKDGTGSFLNKNGEYLLPFIIEADYDFENGYARCSYHHTAFYIDKTGKMYCTFAMPLESLSPELRDILAKGELLDYINGRWIIKKDGLINVLDTSAKKSLPESYVAFHESSDFLYLKDTKGKYYFYTRDKFDPVAGEMEAILHKAVLLDDAMAWYKQYSDTIPRLQKAKQIQLGDQIWAVEDLKARRFNNGEKVPQANTPAEFGEMSKKKLPCFYSPDPGFYGDSAFIYNYYAITDKRGLIPKGWKVPSRKEWGDLLNFVGSDSVAGNYLPRLGFNNPGWIMWDGQYQNTIPAWWTADVSEPGYHYSLMMFQPLGGLMKFIDYTSDGSGFSIRLLKQATLQKNPQIIR